MAESLATTETVDSYETQLEAHQVEWVQKGIDIRVRVFNKFPWFFYPAANRATNHPRYEMMIKQQMKNIMSSQHTFPNMPGVPFL